MHFQSGNIVMNNGTEIFERNMNATLHNGIPVNRSKSRNILNAGYVHGANGPFKQTQNERVHSKCVCVCVRLHNRQAFEVEKAIYVESSLIK